MAIIVRHGGEAHVMRPDGVYRTSVIRPFVGYSPQADVQAVAQQFTQGGPLATDLRGLGWGRGMYGLGAPGPIKRFFMRIKARRAAKQARPFMFEGGQDPSTNLIVSSQVAPQMQAQMLMLEHLTRSANPGHVRAAIMEAASTLAHRRPFTFYRAG